MSSILLIISKHINLNKLDLKFLLTFLNLLLYLLSTPPSDRIRSDVHIGLQSVLHISARAGAGRLRAGRIGQE